jgi:hypothetical protein
MGILIFIAFILVLITVKLQFCKKYRLRNNYFVDDTSTFEEFLLYLRLVISVFYAVILMYVATVQLMSPITVIEVKEERKVLVAQLSRIDNSDLIVSGDVGSMQYVYEDILRFNQKIEVARQYEDNFFIGLFIVRGVSRVDKIHLGYEYDFLISR